MLYGPFNFKPEVLEAPYNLNSKSIERNSKSKTKIRFPFRKKDLNDSIKRAIEFKENINFCAIAKH